MEIKGKKRIRITKLQNWVLEEKERLAVKELKEYLNEVGSCTITQIYNQVVYKQYKCMKNNAMKRYFTKYLLMYLKMQGSVKFYCNRGSKVIKKNF